MKTIRVVIIGGNACGMKTAARLKRRSPECDITVVEKSSFISYGSCGFPYYVSGAVTDYRSLIGGAQSLRDVTYFNDVKGVRVLIRHEAVVIDRSAKTVDVLVHDSGGRIKLSYDKLVLATGGIPALPAIEGFNDVFGTFTVTTMNDAVAVREYIEKHNVRNAVIAGGGFIGIELAEALTEKGLKTTIIKKSASILPAMFDKEMSLLIAKVLASNNVRLLTGADLTRLESDESGRLIRAVSENNDVLEAGVLIVAKGFLPNVGLAVDAGLEISDSGAVLVNENMRTSDLDIYAGGDCVESTNLVTGRKMHLAMGSLANMHGRVIADCIAGDAETFPGVPGTAIFKIFDYTVTRTGLTESEALRCGYDVVSVIVPGQDKPAFYPGSKMIITKLIADRSSHRILGAQIIGQGDAAKRMEIVVTAVTCEATVEQLSKLNLAYSPPYSPPLDNIIVASNVMRNKLDGLAVGCSPLEVKEKFDRQDDFIYLDVRSAAEFEHRHIDHPAVRLLPLNKLRDEAQTLPKDKEIIVSCMSSLRAYEGQLILKSMGFEDVRFMDGGLLAWPY